MPAASPPPAASFAMYVRRRSSPIQAGSSALDSAPVLSFLSCAGVWSSTRQVRALHLACSARHQQHLHSTACGMRGHDSVALARHGFRDPRLEVTPDVPDRCWVARRWHPEIYFTHPRTARSPARKGGEGVREELRHRASPGRPAPQSPRSRSPPPPRPVLGTLRSSHELRGRAVSAHACREQRDASTVRGL